MTLTETRRRKIHDDPELFATYRAWAEQARDVAAEHVTTVRAVAAGQVMALLLAGLRVGVDP